MLGLVGASLAIGLVLHANAAAVSHAVPCAAPANAAWLDSTPLGIS